MEKSSDGSSVDSQQHSRTVRGLTPVTSSSTNPQTSPRQNDGLSQQTRRLQLRNAGFRGTTILPARRISPIFRSQSYSEPANGSPINETCLASPDRRTLYGEERPPSPVNILQEIHNSSKARKRSPRPGLGNIFQDHTATDSTISLSGRSWYHESSNSSPISLGTSPINMMKLREGSLNQRTPQPVTSPLAKQAKGRNAARPLSRSASFEASKYIEHLESQLTALNTKLDALVSPNTNKARVTKLRALTVESRSLRHELADWETSFAERVKEGIEQGLEVEAGLKARAQAAEDEGRIKDMKIKELEFENETLHLKLKDTESLEITNANLEKRIDALTSLLVQSPSKFEHGSTASSPTKGDPHRRVPRPRSMLSPAGGVRLSLSTIGESTFMNPQSFRSNSSISESPEQTDGHSSEGSSRSPEAMTELQHTDIFNEDPGSRSSHRSVRSSSSRPTSFHSTSSYGASSWGLPCATDRDGQINLPHRQRRMRRFPSGAGSLKPLILPSAAGTPCLPASAPLSQATNVFSRDISNSSLDPSSPSPSQQSCFSPTETPTHARRIRSNTWAQEQALRSLEGRPRTSNEVMADKNNVQSPPRSTDGYGVNGINESPQSEQRSRPRSLEQELKQAILAGSETSFVASFEDGLIQADRESGSADKVPVPLEPVEPSVRNDDGKRFVSPASQAFRLRRRNDSLSSDITPRPPKVPDIVSSPPDSPPASPPKALAPSNLASLCTRLTSMITRTKQDPKILARRLLYNAWTLGSARLGGVAWWLLGPLSGFRSRNGQTDDVTGEVPPIRAFDWRPYTAQASRRRTAQCFLSRRCGSEDRARRPMDEDQGDDIEPHVFPCEFCEEPSLRRTFRLWFQFSLTIVLAVGIAVQYGPSALLTPESPSSPGYRRRILSPHLESPAESREHEQSRRKRLAKPSYSSNPLTFAHVLGPTDLRDGRIL